LTVTLNKLLALFFIFLSHTHIILMPFSGESRTVFMGRMHFLLFNQQRQSTEGFDGRKFLQATVSPACRQINSIDALKAENSYLFFCICII